MPATEPGVTRFPLSPPTGKGVTQPRRFRLSAALTAFGLSAGVLTVSAAAISASVAQAVDPTGSAYSPVNPTRVADSRDGFGISSKLENQDARTLKVVTPAVAAAAGANASNVSAVAVQVTATQTAAPGFFTVFPADKPQPLAASLNWMRANHTITNLVSVPVSPSGEIKIFASASAHVVVDVQGVFTRAEQSRSGRLILFDSPYRHLDTRESTRLVSGSITVVDLSGQVPASASTAVVNLTSVDNREAGFLTAFPYGSKLPTASNLNTPDPALGAAAAGSQGYVALKDGKFNVYTQGDTHLVIDVAGYFTGSSAVSSSDGLFVPVTPFRMLDTREANNVPSCFEAGRVRSGGAIPTAVADRGGIPQSNVYAVAANIGLTGTSGGGFARVWPAGAAEPETSSVNSGFANHTVANHAATKVGAAGISVRTAGAMHIILDVAGYYTGSPAAAVADVECTPSENQKTQSEQFSAEVIVLTNIERAAAGAPPVALHPLLIEAGKIHALDQVEARCASGFLSHVGTDGSRAGDRIERAGLWVNGWGENLGCGQLIPASVVEGWMNSPSHKVNLLNPIWTHIGVYALHYKTEPGPQADWDGFYWAQTFAKSPCLWDDLSCRWN